MPLEFRSTTPADLPRIQALLRAAFNAPANARALDSALLRWKYWESTGAWNASRSFALEQDGELVAHGSVWPVCIPGVNAANLLDWASARMPPGAGISLVRRLAEIVPVLVSTGGSPATRAIMPRIGFRHLGNQNIYARVLRPWRQHRTRPREPLHRALPRLVRNVAWSAAPAVPLRGWRVRRAESVDDTAASHVMKCPAARASVWLLQHPGGRNGYFVLSLVDGQMRIARLRIESETAADWAAAYSLAAATALNEPEACEVAALSSSRRVNEALEANGFHFRAQRPVFLYDPQRLVANAAALDFDMLDDDMSYLHLPGYPYFA